MWASDALFLALRPPVVSLFFSPSPALWPWLSLWLSLRLSLLLPLWLRTFLASSLQ